MTCQAVQCHTLQGAYAHLRSHRKVCNAGLLAHTAEAPGEGVAGRLSGAWGLSWPTSSLSTTGYLQTVGHCLSRGVAPAALRVSIQDCMDEHARQGLSMRLRHCWVHVTGWGVPLVSSRQTCQCMWHSLQYGALQCLIWPELYAASRSAAEANGPCMPRQIEE